MKWYFACNKESKHIFPLIKAAVISAKRNTTLEPHFIYDGEEDEMTRWLESHGVKIIYHRVSFFKELEKRYSKEDLHIPAGAYLRCDIPIIEKEDDIVLYTDCDVLFLKDIDVSALPDIDYFSCSSQFDKRNFTDFNTGVMFMNVRNLRQTHGEFVEFIKNNQAKMIVFDQSAYQLFYGSKNKPLDIKFNHKPYWGIDDRAVILHWHGPKPVDFTSEESIKNFNYTYYLLFRKNTKAYDYYLNLFRAYYEDISYAKEAIELMKRDVYPLKKMPNRPFRVRLYNFCTKRKQALASLFSDLCRRKP